MRPTRSDDIRVIPRNLRWEVAVNGVTRPMIDWLCTEDRAVEHAMEEAREILRWTPRGERVVVVVETADGREARRITVEPSASSGLHPWRAVG